MTRTGIVGGLGLFFALACGGAGGGGLVGPSVGPYAQEMSTYLEEEHGVPAPTYRVGDEVKVGDFTWKVERVIAYEPETDASIIKNMDERRALQKEGAAALGVLYSIRNDTPVAKKLDVHMWVRTADGQKGMYQAYAEYLFLDEHGREERPRTFPPGEWVESGAVLAVNGEAVDGSIGWIRFVEKEYDPSDPRGRRKIDVMKDQAVIDFGEVERGGHLNPAKR